jgi:hypothetical protein
VLTKVAHDLQQTLLRGGIAEEFSRRGAQQALAREAQ